MQLGLKMQRNDFVERMDSLQHGIYQAGEDILRHQQQMITIVEHQSTPRALRRIHSIEGHSHSYTRLPISETEAISSPGKEASESCLNLMYPPIDMPTQLFSNSPSQASFLNGSPLRRNSSLSSQGSSKVISATDDRRPSSSIDDLSSDDCTSPTDIATFSNSSLTKILVAPYKSSKRYSSRRGSYSSSQHTSYDSYTFPCRPVAPPSGTLQNVKEDESLDAVSCSDSLVDEVSPGSMVMRVSSATGQLEQVPKTHLPVKKHNSCGSRYVNHTRQSSTPPTGGKLLPDTFTLNRADGVILRLAQEPSCSPKIHRMRRANSIVLNSIETTV